MRWRQRLNDRTERGASAVEFALVAPLLILVLFGIATFGFLFAQDLALSNAARQAARFAAVAGHTCDDVKAEAIAAAPLVDDLGADDITVSMDDGISAGCGSSTAEPCRESEDGASVAVDITYEADVILPVPGLGSTRTLSSKGVFRCEFS
ncbi:pilus assembly protein [Nocardioides sp. STR2]|uniref:Pilus assembly protein n=1 Tax=Nocardioides pini TaxID=2975053 RepID=A0ABT4CEY1_9ACTN|nr:TadE family protein [Nocardioides pini]MCY4727538.1 pilus assembly protein [Nocardioides pini]